MDPVYDSHLLWICEEALDAPLPEKWSEHFDTQVYRNSVKLFKELTTLKKTVNVPKDIEDYKVRDINQTKLIKFSEKYRLNI